MQEVVEILEISKFSISLILVLIWEEKISNGGKLKQSLLKDMYVFRRRQCKAMIRPYGILVNKW